jgi:hypothetical protein
MRWLSHFAEFSVSKPFYSKRVSDVEAFVADAHRGGGKCFVVHADEKLTAFPELESVVRAASC